VTKYFTAPEMCSCKSTAIADYHSLNTQCCVLVFCLFFYLNTQVLFPAHQQKCWGRNSFLGVAVRHWLALLPKAVGAPSLEVPSDTDGQPELLGGQPAHSRGWDSMGFKVPSNPTHSMKKFLKSTGIPGPQPQRQQCPNSTL